MTNEELAVQLVDVQVTSIDLRVGNVEIVGKSWDDCTVKVDGFEIEACSVKLTCDWNKSEPMRIVLELPVRGAP